MILGDCIGPEKIDYEYKEFCLKEIGFDLFNDNEILDILNGKWHPELNKLILSNVSIYIEHYVTKCFSAFCNSKINGNLIIGCNDYGEITGIPYECKLHIDSLHFREFVKQKINDEFDNNLSKIIDYDVVVTELKVNDNILFDEVKPLIKKFRDKTKEYNKQQKKFTDEKTIWMKHVLKYSVKLKILINNLSIRNEIIQFIKDKHGSENVIKQLSNNKFIKPPNGQEIQFARDNGNTNTLAYWISRFKDEVLDEIMLLKPKRPKIQLPQNPFMILHRLSLLRKNFSKNHCIKYFLIKISLKKQPHETILYNDNLKGWVGSIRLFEKKGPCNMKI